MTQREQNSLTGTWRGETFTFLMKLCRMDVLSHWVLRKSSISPARNEIKYLINNVNNTTQGFWDFWGSSEPTCVGRRCSARQSRYCYGPPGWREASGCPHPSWWVDPLLAPVARQTGAHSTVGAVRWRWYMGALLWVASILGMVQSILIRWWTICFRSHILAWLPPIGKMYYYL